MDIGKPRRLYRVEPVVDPVPAKKETEEPRTPVAAQKVEAATAAHGARVTPSR